jgi:hypothetical protein
MEDKEFLKDRSPTAAPFCRDRKDEMVSDSSTGKVPVVRRRVRLVQSAEEPLLASDKSKMDEGQKEECSADTQKLVP